MRYDGVCPLTRERWRSRAPRAPGTADCNARGAMSDITQHLSDGVLTLPQVDRSITGVNHQQISAAVQLAANLALTNLSFGRDRHVQIDVAIPGVQVYVGCQI